MIDWLVNAIKKVLSIRRFSSPLITVLIFSAFGASVALLLNMLAIFEKLELLSLDIRYRLRPEIKKSDQIVLVNFDDVSLSLYGHWPWSRLYQTILVDTLSYFKVSAIGYDVFFSEEEPATLKKSDKDNSFSIKNNDREFQRAISQSGVVYLAYSSRDPYKGLSKDEIMKEVSRLRGGFSDQKRQSIAYMERMLIKAPQEIEGFLYKSIDIDPPIYNLLSSSRGFGFAQPGYNKDSTVRNFILFRYYNGYILNPLTLVMFSHLADFDITKTAFNAGKEVVLRDLNLQGKRKDLIIPVDENFQALLNWPGTFDSSFIHISYKDIVYLHAFNLARQIFRKDNTVQRNLELITKAMSEDFLLPEKEIEGLALKISMAGVIMDYLKKGYSDERIIDSLKGFLHPDKLREIISNSRLILIMEGYFKGNKTVKFSEFVNLHNLPMTKELENLFDDYKSEFEVNSIYPYILPPKIPAKINGINQSISPYMLKNKAVLVGLTGENTIDLNPTPFEKDCPMVFYHASGLNMMLTGQFLHFPPVYMKEIAVILSAFLISLIGVYRSVSALTLFSILSLFIYTFLTYRFWIDKGQWLEYVPVVTVVIITYISTLLRQFIKVYGEKTKIRSIFSNMVSPAVLTFMENNPEKFALTGERRFATTYFSKIDAIDQIAHTFSPEQLPVFLSNYLTPMSDVIIEYNGYIDKYEGAVIMADFGVPLEDSDSCIKCSFASLQQRFFIETFKYTMKSRYNILPKVSIGFNAGYVSAGNMGSDKKFQYTVMGDSVNMSARFMAANSIYESNFAITSEETVSLLKDYVYSRPLDKILLKGKTVPTMIYDVIGWKADAYREFMRDKPIPSFIDSFWVNIQGEGIIYLGDYWTHKYERLDIPLAKDIAGFFKASYDMALFIISLEIILELVKLRKDAISLFNLTLSSQTDSIKDYITEIKDSLLTLSQNNSNESSDKVNALKTRANLLSVRYQNMIDLLKKDLFKTFINASEDVVSKELMKIYDQYRNKCKGFVKNLKPKDYFNLLSLVGEPENKGLIEIFEKGLHAYWQRDWLKAEEIFKKGIHMDDQPLKEMIKRIEEYKQSPPGPQWQGEYIQTKK